MSARAVSGERKQWRDTGRTPTASHTSGRGKPRETTRRTEAMRFYVVAETTVDVPPPGDPIHFHVTSGAGTVIAIGGSRETAEAHALARPGGLAWHGVTPCWGDLLCPVREED